MEKPHRALLPGVLIATLIAGALRLASLGTVPVSLYCDEAFSGYEAFCILLTGHDSLLPLALASGFWLAARAVAGTINGSTGGDPRVRPGPLNAGAAVLGLSLYTYTIARLAMPLLLAGFVGLHRRALARSARPTA